MRTISMKKLAILCASVLFFAACSSDPEDPGQHDDGQLEGVSFKVDESLSPSLEALGERRLVGIIDENGVQVDFVAEELIFVGDEGLDDFLDRWDGTVVTTTDFGEFAPDMPVLHQVVLDPSRGDIEGLVELYEQFDEPYAGDFTATDEDALGLLAITAEELVIHGNEVTINPYMPFQEDRMAYIDETLQAAKDGDDDLVGGESDDYDRNPSSWFHYNSGSTQDIGVTDAWRALALAGLSDPEDVGDRVRILILDGGFLDFDLPPGSHSAVFGSPNIANCGSSACPWHGIAVAQVAAGDPHSGVGTIGTGGPVATVTMLGVEGDWKSAIVSLAEGLIDLATDSSDVRIINISAGYNFHWALEVGSVLSGLMGTLFTNLRTFGNILTLAAAGNQGMHLHAEQTCNPLTGNCWDTYRYLPCQAGGVVCIGGLETDGLGRHSSSNHGAAVDLWAPYVNYVGLNPLLSEPDEDMEKAYARSGTSYSSPYVAGVAAMVMAADPSLSAREVRDLLYDTARDGEGWASRYVQARTAVYDALGGAPFSMDFAHPQDGAVYQRGQRIRPRVEFAGGSHAATLEWRLDGEVIGTGTTALIEASETLDFELRTYEISVTAEAGPYELTRSRQIEIVNSPPSVAMQSPSEGQVYYESSTIPLFATSTDIDSPGGALEDSQITWSEASSGTQLATGHQAFIAGHALGLGTSTIEVTADDGHDAVSRQVTITIEEDPDVLPPDAVIIAPDDGTFYAQQDACCFQEDGHFMGFEIDFEGQAWHAGTELDDQDIVWTTTVDKNHDGQTSTRVIGTGTSFTAILYHDDSACQSPNVEHVVEMTATGPDGVSRTVSISLFFGTIVC